MSEYKSENGVPMIPKHQAEMHDMHLVHENSNMKTLCIIVIIILAIVAIATAWANVEISKNNVNLTKTFVDNYTARTEKWLETLLYMETGKWTVTGVLNEEVQTRDIQQLPVP